MCFEARLLANARTHWSKSSCDRAQRKIIRRCSESVMSGMAISQSALRSSAGEDFLPLKTNKYVQNLIKLKTTLIRNRTRVDGAFLQAILCPIESVGSSVPMFMKGAIESNCPSTSKSFRIFQNFHEHRDGTVHTLDGTQYTY